MSRILVALLVLVVAAWAILTFHPVESAPRFVIEPRSISASDTQTEVIANSPVMPGGVNLAKILQMMKVGFYADVEASTLHAVVVTADFDSYVQYRRGDKIYWSKKKITIHRGTLLFCDAAGKCIKADCGNELSLEPSGPIEPDEPVGTDLADNFPPVDGEPQPVSFTPSNPILPDSPPTTSGTPPIFIGGGCCTGGITLPPNQIVQTPEGSTIFMTLMGAAVVAIFWRKRRQQ